MSNIIPFLLNSAGDVCVDRYLNDLKGDLDR